MASKWKPGKPMPRPTADQLKHPKRLLFSDLKLKLWHCACKPLRTLVAMGDMNTDLYAEHRRGKDRCMLLDMTDELKIVSCGQAAWLRAHVGFVTHGGGSVHADSHIDYILVSEASATSLRRFSVHADPNLCEDRGGRHAALFASIGVVAVLGVAKPQSSVKAQGRFQSAVKYSDKPRVARFRDFSTKFFGKRGLDEAMESLIGNIVLGKDLQRRAGLGRDEAERQGWEEVHWRPADAERKGAERGGEANRGSAGRAADDGTEHKRRRTRAGERDSGGECSTTPSGRRSEGDCPVGAANVTTTGSTLRRVIDEAMQLLGSMAHDADLAFGQTHGGARRCVANLTLVALETGTQQRRNASHWSARSFGVWCASSTSAS